MSTSEKGTKTSILRPRQLWSRRKKTIIIMGVVSFLVILSLAVGLGVGLPRDRWHDWGHGSSSSSTPTATPTPSPSPGGNGPTAPGGVWQPVKGVSWNYQLAAPLGPSPTKGNTDVWDIDLFDNDANAISALKSQGAHVICYFSAGSSEDWRPDFKDFKSSDLGHALDGWEGESWLNIKSPTVQSVMTARLDLAKSKGCSGVDPDNVDGYNNDNGLGLTSQDSVAYLHFLSDAAHSRGLSIGLKNAADIVPQVVDKLQWCVNEECAEWDECDKFAPFIDQNKPVFHVEYPKGPDTNNFAAVPGSAINKACDATGTDGFSTIIKNMNLDQWTQTC